MGTTLMYGTLGEILTEKSGNMNLGVEGLVYMGGSSGLIAAFLYERAAGANAVPMVAVILAFVAAFLAAALGSLLYAFLTITLRTNQNVTGLALTIFGVGYGEFFGESATGGFRFPKRLVAFSLSRCCPHSCGTFPWWERCCSPITL